MNKKPYIELLAPAGGPDQFRAALAAGADAIYCGVGNNFNARRGADNFDLNTFEEACREAHIAGVRVYVTLNVLIKENEMHDALELVRNCAQHGADAFIIQDWGLFTLIHHMWPEIELHVSTQANIHDANGVRWCAEQGAKRVTLSRELSLEEIAEIHKVAKELNVDLEIFGHGALCFCYSGLCLLSSMMGGRSANRGLCAQPCRLLYELVDAKGNILNAPERTRPLCPKDACTIGDIAALVHAGAGALKIEGRMKAPDYVYNVVSAYRKQIDAVYAAYEAGEVDEVCGTGEDKRITTALGGTPVAPEIKRQLKRVFNRDFTDAYLRGTSGDEMMSYERSNNRGELVGEVLSCKGTQEQRRDGKGNLHKDPRQNKHKATCRARIKLTEPVGAGDLLELRSPSNYDDFLTATVPTDAQLGETIEVKLTRPMPSGSTVRLIRSKAAHTATDQALAQEHPRKRNVSVHIIARVGEPFRVTLACVDGHPDIKVDLNQTWPAATAEGFTVEQARTKAVTKDELIEHVGRMGTTPFNPTTFTVDLDPNVGMSFSAVHKVRAAASEALEQEILATHTVKIKNLAPIDTEALKVTEIEAYEQDNYVSDTLSVFAPTLEVAHAAHDAGADVIYLPYEVYRHASPSELNQFMTEYEVSHYLGPSVYPVFDEVARGTAHASFDELDWIFNSLVGNISDYYAARGTDCYTRRCSTIPIFNSWTSRVSPVPDPDWDIDRNLNEHVVSVPLHGGFLSPELSCEELRHLSCTIDASVVVYGRPRVMTSEHCVLQAANRCIHDCAHCKLRKQAETEGIFLKTKDGKLLPVRTDIYGRSRIYGPEVLDYMPEISKITFPNGGVHEFAIDAALLSPKETAHELKRLRNVLKNIHKTIPEDVEQEEGTTAGHLYDPIS